MTTIKMLKSKNNFLNRNSNNYKGCVIKDLRYTPNRREHYSVEYTLIEKYHNGEDKVYFGCEENYCELVNNYKRYYR